MAVLPSTNPYPAYENILQQRFRTIISMHDQGNEQRRAKWDFPRYDITLTYNALDSSQVQILWNFYQARQGAYESFFYFAGKAEGVGYNWSSIYVGTADGTSTAFNLPGISITSATGLTIYKNTSAIDSSHVVLNTTAGANGEDTISLSTTPSPGDVITASFTGYLRCRVRFKEDNMSRSLFEYRLYRTGLELIGLGEST